MKRLHLFEFEDQPWFPSVIRNCMTDFLTFVANKFDFYQSIVPVLEEGIKKSGGATIVDLAAGGGGAWKKLAPRLKESVPDLKIVLTDQYPNLDAFSKLESVDPDVFTFESGPVDATDVPGTLAGLRTQFLSLHHFKPESAKQILQNAVNAAQPIAIFEAQKRDVTHLIKFALSPIAVLLMTPMIRPFKWSRLLLTYLIPVVPLFTFWDGLVSVLRTYSAEELREMTGSLEGSDSFIWEIGEAKSGDVTIPYLLGYPK